MNNPVWMPTEEMISSRIRIEASFSYLGDKNTLFLSAGELHATLTNMMSYTFELAME
jgi:hypothetical protein